MAPARRLLEAIMTQNQNQNYGMTFVPSHLSNPTARENGVLSTGLKLGAAFWTLRVISVPIAFGLSYTRNRSLMLGVVQGLFFPWIYLGYRGVQAATKEKGEKK